ncbi:putative late blight resistance protein homolog R1A-10 [Salvia hispanica]|uniref:putative late blight resistance protein homolog R1A-10 n=1 Tax=Salvia hispanica TaxID=49212 RepID=UPI0020091185|nr:putative late blight resistance protein homolog R1A-10 [Salvia hispanica]
MDDPNDELIEVISQGPSKLRLVAIYEVEGLWNTFLARTAYSDPPVVENYIRAWATVSGKYHLPAVIRDLLRSMKVKSSSNSENKLIQALFENLRGMRYLIVLDDQTASEFFDFDRLIFDILPNKNNGSRIIVTTKTIAYVEFTHNFIRVGFMYEDRAWKLLLEEIFKGDPCPSHLVFAGKMIARSCRWVPDCIGVISVILVVADQTEVAWEDISDNIKFAASSDFDNRKSSILSLGYTYLPHHLRSCFLYLLMFNEYGVGLHVSTLIKLWVAEGFLYESECKSFEEAGEDYVEELVRRNLVSVIERKSNGRIKSVRMDYDIRDFFLKQGHVDSSILRIDCLPLELNSCNHRHVSARVEGDFLEGVNGSTIRTIMLCTSKSQRDFSLSIGNVRLLRILDLSYVYHYDLHEEVFELVHLRYLAFHYGFSISEAISSLVNLQTLIIYPRESGFMIIGSFAEEIWRMPQLRHLLLFCFELPAPKGALEDLQTLSTVVDFVCLRENLKMIPNLKKLALLYAKRWSDYELHNLIYLQKLEILKIEMDWSFVEQQKIMSCVFPPTLKKLSLSNVRLGWDDMKSVGLLPNLQVLKLRKLACIGKTWETSEGGFSQLTYLLIQESNLEHWITEATHFRLNSLVLRRCWYLNEVPSDIRKILTLKYIYLGY